MSESPNAAYGMDGFYIRDATVWSLDAVERAVEGMDAVRQGERELSPLPDATRQWPQSCCGGHMRTERSRPVDDKREGLTAFIDDPTHCPVVFNRNS